MKPELIMKRGYLLPTGCSDLNQMVRVIGEDGKHLGVLGKFEAIKIAKAQSADLILVSRRAKPPIYRIIDPARIRRALRKCHKR